MVYLPIASAPTTNHRRERRRSGAFYVGLSEDEMGWEPAMLRGISRGEVAHLAQIGRDLHRSGFQYLPGRHLLIRKGSASCNALPYRYLGADDKAGPNYTGQAAIDSYYERVKI